MTKLHQVLGALATSALLFAAMPAMAAAPAGSGGQSSVTAAANDTAGAPKKQAHRRYFRRTAAHKTAVPASETETTANLNRQSLHAAEAGRTAEFVPASKTGKTAQRPAGTKSAAAKVVKTKIAKEGKKKRGKGKKVKKKGLTGMARLKRAHFRCPEPHFTSGAWYSAGPRLT